MTDKRQVEVFTAGCVACDEAVQLVQSMACPSCDVQVLDMQDASVAARAKKLGIQRVPAVVINGRLADCCAEPCLDETALKAAGLGQPAI
ncbi:hypothetical protein GC176_02045 [bacterium]|nr:hypothetical protein [bacterium]